MAACRINRKLALSVFGVHRMSQLESLIKPFQHFLFFPITSYRGRTSSYHSTRCVNIRVQPGATKQAFKNVPCLTVFLIHITTATTLLRCICWVLVFYLYAFV